MSDSILSKEQRRALNEVLDELIPPNPDRKLPGAGEIDLATAVDKALARNPGMQPVIEQGLATVAEIVGAHDLDGFAAAAAPQRGSMMRELEAKDAGFIMTLMFVAYAAYYQHERVLACLGLEARAPHPRGYDMRPHDLTLLEPVRRRGRIFR
jgi:hypothetical protein